MTTQTPDAVREALEQRAIQIITEERGAEWATPKIVRAMMRFRDEAALDSRAGDAGEVVWRRTALDAAKDCQRVRHSSATPQERDDALRQAATMLRSFADAATPAPAVDAVPDGEDQAARDRRMYDQGRRDERAGEPEAFQ